MKAKTASKLVTSLMVLLLVLSCVMVLQYARAEERELGTVEGIVRAQDGSRIPQGFMVELIDLVEDEILTSYTEKGGYFQFTDLNDGYYEIHVPSQTHARAYHRVQTDEVLEVTEGDIVFREVEVESRRLDHKLEGNVEDEDGDVVEDAEITVFENDVYSKSVGLKNLTTGHFEMKVYEGTLGIIVEAEDFAPYVDEITFDSDMVLNVTLKETPTVSGYLWYEDDEGNTGAVRTETEVTLIPEDEGKILRETMPAGNPWFDIGATEGEYTLVVSADGYMPHVEKIDVPDDDTNIPLGRVFVSPVETEEVNTEVEFDGWETIEVNRTKELFGNSRMMTMDYWYLGNLRMQIDMALGDGDMNLTQEEVDEYKEWLEYREAKRLNTQRFFTLNGIIYELDLDNVTYDADELDALVGDTTEPYDERIEVRTELTYHAVDMIEDDEDYEMGMTIMNNQRAGNLVEYKYIVSLPEGFERVSSNLEDIPSGVVVEGYREIHITSEIEGGRSDLVFDIRQSEEGEAEVILVEDEHVYLMEDEKYAVRQDEEVTLIADFLDPVGDEAAANYTWYVDGTELEEYGDEITHVFTTESTVENPTNISLEVTSAGGLVVYAYADVVVDGTGPTGEIEVDPDTTIGENEEIQFSAYNFTDEVGIRSYEWNFSDDTDLVRDMNVSHAFELYGDYTVTLNVTDNVGNWNEETIEITVEDTTDPVARFVAIYDDEEIESDNITEIRLERGQEISLDASISYDPPGLDNVEGDIEVEWWISGVDFHSTEFEVLNYSFQETGTYDLHLNVTDEAGNYNNISRPVEVRHGPSPNLEVTDLTLAEESIRVGDTVTVIANVTNYGTSNATDISVVFRVDGEVQDMTPRFFLDMDNETADEMIPMDEYRLIKFEWDVENEGENTLNVNITDSQEPVEWHFDNEIERTFNADPPQWRVILGYVLVPVIIIGVAVGLYYFKDEIQEKLGR